MRYQATHLKVDSMQGYNLTMQKNIIKKKIVINYLFFRKGTHRI